MTAGPEGPRRGRARLVRRLDRAPETRSLFLRVEDGPPLRFRAGQFVSLELPLGGARPVPRAYTIVSEPGAELLEICLDRVPGGAGSAYLFSLDAGAVLDFAGPLGFFTLDAVPPGECVFLADGTGIAAVRGLAAEALAAGVPGPLRLFHAASDDAHWLWREELERLAATEPRFEFHPCPRSGGADPLLAAVEARWVPAGSPPPLFFLCGAGEPIVRVRDRLRAAGHDRRAVRLERW